MDKRGVNVDAKTYPGGCTTWLAFQESPGIIGSSSRGMWTARYGIGQVVVTLRAEPVGQVNEKKEKQLGDESRLEL